MYAIVANGIQAIVPTQRQLNAIIAVYPYPKFRWVRTKEEGRAWILKNSRTLNTLKYDHYGDAARWGYAKISYAIRENYIDYRIDTRKLGFIKIPDAENTLVDSRPEMLHVIVKNVSLDDNLITHHVIAIRRILRLLGRFIDVDIVVPDISVYLAMTKYTGKNYIINGLQKELNSRTGAVAITVLEDLDAEEEVTECQPLQNQ